MQETKNATAKASDTQRADKLYMESNLLRVAGALFCHDQKAAGSRTAQIELNAGVTEKHIILRLDPKLGQPGPLAHKIFVALVKKHPDYGKPIRSEIHFTRREIGRLIGRKEWGGRDSAQLSRALHEIHHTFVTTHFNMRCFFHFANLYNGVNRSRLTFPKRYDDICHEWLGGLARCAHRSIIERDQLGPHLKQLVGSGFLASYDISKAKGRDGFVITFKPGRAFFDDYDRFYRRRAQGQLQWEFQADQREIGAPLKLAYLFTEKKRTGRLVASVAYVNSKDVETAKQFLTEITVEQAPAFIDFALTEAKKTAFDVQTLGGLRQYLAPFKARQVSRAVAEERKATDRRGEDQRLGYDSYRRREATAIFGALPADKQQEIEALARQAAAGFGGSLAAAMLGTKRLKITAQRYSDRIKSFQDWAAGAL